MEEAKKLNRFYIFPILYVLSVYMAISNIFTGNKGLLYSLMFLSPFILGILNIVVCVRCCLLWVVFSQPVLLFQVS